MTAAVAQNVKLLRTRLGLTQGAFAERLKVQQSYVSKWEAQRVEPAGDSIAAMAAIAGCSFDDFKYGTLPELQAENKVPSEAGTTPESLGRISSPALGIPQDTDELEMVGIRMIDMAYGMGATYAVDFPEVEVLQFPKQWIEVITYTPAHLLTWTRGKGDSMEPTIRDGDIVMLDQSQRTLTERDAMWAFTIGEEAAIKRLRRQGERCQIFSDNPAVPPDEQLLRDIHIVGRVVFVGARK